MPYNKLYRPAARRGSHHICRIYRPSTWHSGPVSRHCRPGSPIQKAHILVSLANAMQPGVFGISAWDLVGALPVPASSVSSTLNRGWPDWRWINRGAVDLMNNNPSATTSTCSSAAESPDTLRSIAAPVENPNSFASQIKQMLAARKKYGVDQATMNAVPPTGNQAVCVLAMTLPDQSLAITALNYGRVLIGPGRPYSSSSGIPRWTGCRPVGPGNRQRSKCGGRF